jgi:hypothetical protein
MECDPCADLAIIKSQMKRLLENLCPSLTLESGDALLLEDGAHILLED